MSYRIYMIIFKPVEEFGLLINSNRLVFDTYIYAGGHRVPRIYKRVSLSLLDGILTAQIINVLPGTHIISKKTIANRL